MDSHVRSIINAYKRNYAAFEKLGIDPALHAPRVSYTTFMAIIAELERLEALVKSKEENHGDVDP